MARSASAASWASCRNENTADDKSQDAEDRQHNDDGPSKRLTQAPAHRPHSRSSAAQMHRPTTLAIRKLRHGMTLPPANRPATVRSTGTNCAMKTILPPWRKNKYWPSLIRLWRHPDIIAVAQQQPIAVFAADHIADHAADNGRCRRRNDDRDDIEIVLGAGIDRRRKQRRFAGQRKADAFQADDRADGDKSISVDKILKKFHAGDPAAQGVQSNLFSTINIIGQRYCVEFARFGSGHIAALSHRQPLA